MQRTQVSSLPVVGVVLAASLLLAGCSGSGPASGPGPVSGPAAATSSAPTAAPAASVSSTPPPAVAPPVVATTDTRGAALPPAVVDSARRIGDALASGDPAPLRDLYSPATGAASWRVVADRLSAPANQAKLISALRNPPESRPEIAYLFSDGDHGLGMTVAGRLAFVGVGQRPASAAGGSDPDAPPFWAGERFGHGRSLYYADPAGRGTMTFRTYEMCPSDRPGVPCEPNGPQQVAVVLLTIDGPAGGPYRATVVESNDRPEVPVGAVLPVRELAGGAVAIGSGDMRFTFCRSDSWTEDCGA